MTMRLLFFIVMDRSGEMRRRQPIDDLSLRITRTDNDRVHGSPCFRQQEQWSGKKTSLKKSYLFVYLHPPTAADGEEEEKKKKREKCREKKKTIDDQRRTSVDAHNECHPFGQVYLARHDECQKLVTLLFPRHTHTHTHVELAVHLDAMRGTDR